MSGSKNSLISIVVPIYNEHQGLLEFNESLVAAAQAVMDDRYELIYCDDGSSDNSADIIASLSRDNHNIKLIKLSRNFGKESALAAGIAAARGDAIIMLDGDGQHPVDLISEFINAWNQGYKVVVGVRSDQRHTGYLKKSGSKLFYSIFNKLTHHKLVPGSTDFRLVDKAVYKAFLDLKESDRITRGLIDWLGFSRKYIYFKANPRANGRPGYSTRKLFQLAANSFISLTLTPLFIFGYLGVFITVSSFLTGLAILIEQIIMSDPYHWHFTGTAMLGILTLFLVGTVLMSQGILSLYISHIHTQSKQRPLYVIDYENSVGIDEPLA